LPYQSAAQRRFFYSEGARKAGITPAMVEEWDRETKGKKLPERAEKSAELFSILLKAAAATTSAVRMGATPAPKPFKPMKPGVPAQGQEGDFMNSRGHQDTFRDNASTSAATGADARLQRGEQLTMPT
jgi:hypothetical protein